MQKFNLAGANEFKEINLPGKGLNGTISIEYGDGGTGTIEVQKSLSKVNYYAATLTKPDKTDVTSLAAEGMGYVEIVGEESVIVKMTVAGNCDVYVNAGQG